MAAVRNLTVPDHYICTQYAYAIGKTLIDKGISIDMVCDAVSDSKVLTLPQKRQICKLINIKTIALEKLLQEIKAEYKQIGRNPIPKIDTSKMNEVSANIATALHGLYREEIMYCMRYALEYPDLWKQGEQKINEAKAKIKRDKTLITPWRKLIYALINSSSNDIHTALKELKH